MGGDASRNGAELFETEADFSAKIVTFRLVGGDASPPSPPLNPPLSKACYRKLFCIELLELSLVILWLLYMFGKKKCVMIWLICDSLPFYAHVHTCSPSYTDEE